MHIGAYSLEITETSLVVQSLYLHSHAQGPALIPGQGT